MTEEHQKVAIVTGAAGGIGGATARRLAHEGFRVVLSDLHPGTAEPLAKELNGKFLVADVTQEEEVAALVETALAKYGHLDVMVNNAGVIGAIGSITEIADADWARTQAVLLSSVFYGMKHAARAMRTAGRGGVILSTTSIGGLAPLAPHAYVAAKAGVIGLTKSVAAELAPDGIRVNAVAPGHVPTPLTISALGDEETMRKVTSAQVPMPYLTEPEEVAGAFAYLASDDARTVTGQTLTVDAGVLVTRLPSGWYTKPPTFVGSSTLPD
ncbi:SDR family NAD(P)-dependent oxidoreductase [Streptomyces geranii]|uniref:SDR family NAD(P)-dependent oxidoreductase n=1 Tax=Streptomyces geranii TaxID=2058923 RepID=UPI000D02415E|nr:SDR family oxidoreductase [Streptomyces geranii]